MSTKLYVGNIPWDTTEAALRELFSSCGNVLSLELPVGRNLRSRGYALVEFSSPAESQQAIQSLNGVSVGERQIEVREDGGATTKAAKAAGGPKAGGGGAKSQHPPPAVEGSRVQVDNLSWETTDEELAALCRTAGTVAHAEIIRQSSGRSKGWAVVDFNSSAEAQQAVATLNNTDFGGRTLSVRLKGQGAADKPPAAAKAPRAPRGGAVAGGAPKAPRAPRAPRAPAPERPENSSGRQVVVRNLPWTTSSEDLREVFQQVGTVLEAVAVRHEDTGRSKGWGTVLFETAEQAQAAIQGFTGVELEGRAMEIRLDRYN